MLLLLLRGGGGVVFILDIYSNSICNLKELGEIRDQH